jgi:glyoxylase-like metal-dependent hydrolase (beta-lactamase superfamily II)
MTKAAYETDFYAWTQAQAEALRTKDWPALDVDHLAEEIESLGKRDRRAVESDLEVRLRHGLKWVYQPERRSGSWRRTLTVTRQRLARVLRDNPSLREQLPVLLPVAYAEAREVAAAETGLPLATFPETCPWDLAQVLDTDFWPEDRP